MSVFSLSNSAGMVNIADSQSVFMNGSGTFKEERLELNRILNFNIWRGSRNLNLQFED